MYTVNSCTGMPTLAQLVALANRSAVVQVVQHIDYHLLQPCVSELDQQLQQTGMIESASCSIDVCSGAYALPVLWNRTLILSVNLWRQQSGQWVSIAVPVVFVIVV